MNLYPPVIIAAVVAVWYYLVNKGLITRTIPVGTLPQSPNTPASFAAPGISNRGIDGSPGDVTVQPSGSSSGVPGFVPQNVPFTNNVPGTNPNNINPFQQFGNSTGNNRNTSRSNFAGGANDPFSLQNLLNTLRPFNIPGSPGAATGGCGCGGCANSASNGGGCPSKQSNGACPPNMTPAPNQPVNIPMRYERAPDVAQIQQPMTLAGQVLNLSSPLANPFNVFQNGQGILQESIGEVPAAPTYYN